ncbi:MAG: serine hydroxymethyltransferase, partial [Holdemania filiformis]
INITCNKNTIPFDQEKPFVTSGIRLGTAAMTTRGFQEEEFRQVARWITTVLKNPEDEALKAKLRQEVMEMTARYPLIRES